MNWQGVPRGTKVTRLITKEPIKAKGTKNLDALFHDTLKDIYYAEKKVLATLPKMAKAVQGLASVGRWPSGCGTSGRAL
jgi:hypothetical protein